MKRVSLIFVGLFLSVFLFSLFGVLPMVNGTHCENVNGNPNNLGGDRFACSFGPGVRYTCGDNGEKLRHSCIWDDEMNEGEGLCVDGEYVVYETCVEDLDYQCLDDGVTLSTGQTGECDPLSLDVLGQPKCKFGKVHCPNGCVKGTILDINGYTIDHCKDGVIDSYPDGTIVETDLSLPNTNPFLFKTLLSIFLVVLALVIYVYLKPKNNKKGKKR